MPQAVATVFLVNRGGSGWREGRQREMGLATEGVLWSLEI
jgi:hypothetical protein